MEFVTPRHKFPLNKFSLELVQPYLPKTRNFYYKPSPAGVQYQKCRYQIKKYQYIVFYIFMAGEG
ncbi:hypothetical protein D7V94_06365 [Parablautia intestinalis]|uniref:Uncharacterized protein n=1 Tax=Parablautia intestinalis TaxID=2320100 RepID=A0A3A9B0U7_9FIRM|nr:hypothetical protein D7V94_06365 [Parablautia intestinalis]